jgi:hypothetical protein
VALLGNNVASQIITIQNCNVFKARKRLTIGAWVRLPGSASGGTISYWRQDGTMNPIQHITANLARPAWWDSSNTLINGGSVEAFYANTVVTGYNFWMYCALIFDERTVQGYRFVPRTSAVSGGGLGVAWTSALYANATVPMLLGGTEGNAELMPAGSAIAELSVLGVGLNPSQIPALAQEPAQFRKVMLMHCPLRDPARRTTERVNGRQFSLVYGTTSRAQISSGDHPPVERWRPASSVVFPAFRTLRPSFDISNTGWGVV